MYKREEKKNTTTLRKEDKKNIIHKCNLKM